MGSTAYSMDTSSLSSYTEGYQITGEDYFYMVSSDTEGVEGEIELTLTCFDEPTYDYPTDILGAVTVGETWETTTSTESYVDTCLSDCGWGWPDLLHPPRGLVQPHWYRNWCLD